MGIRVRLPKGYKLVLVPDEPPKKFRVHANETPTNWELAEEQIMALRAHIDEAKTDPDYDVVWSYQADWTLPAD